MRLPGGAAETKLKEVAYNGGDIQQIQAMFHTCLSV